MTDHALPVPMQKRVSLWPKEHGAYVQLAFPILSAWLLGAPGVDAILLGLAAFAAFLAHEPMMLAAGRRGPRKQEATRGRATRRLLVLALVAAALGGLAIGFTTPLVRGALIVPASLGAIALVLAATGREHSLAGELYATVSLTSIAFPVALAAGLGVERAITAVGVWAVGFSLATIAARGVLFQKKDGGRTLRLAVASSIVAALASLALAMLRVVTPWIALAPMPFALAATLLALFPPTPKHMHALGFALVFAATVTLGLLGV